jgi:hypothetical protein
VDPGADLMGQRAVIKIEFYTLLGEELNRVAATAW